MLGEEASARSYREEMYSDVMVYDTGIGRCASDGVVSYLLSKSNSDEETTYHGEGNHLVHDMCETLPSVSAGEEGTASVEAVVFLQKYLVKAVFGVIDLIPRSISVAREIYLFLFSVKNSPLLAWVEIRRVPEREMVFLEGRYVHLMNSAFSLMISAVLYRNLTQSQNNSGSLIRSCCSFRNSSRFD